MTTTAKYEHIRGKRVAAFDVGMKRIGFAVSDELHITATPRAVFETGDALWNDIATAIRLNRVDVVVVGVPYRHDGETTPMIEATRVFAREIETRLGLPVYLYDESFSSRNASALMVSGGMRKKKRRAKGATDRAAAAVILREFLDEVGRVPC